MGKLDKRIKSERINTIRKQYDAFLEEEKKRKERNELILEKLDKIRSSCSTIALRNSAAPVKNLARSRNQVRFVEIPNSTFVQEINSNENLSYNGTNNFITDSIITELSKTFILIPKLRNDRDFKIQPAKIEEDDENNWKRKYEILAKLKQFEKEPSNYNYCDMHIRDDFTKTDIIRDSSLEIDTNHIEYTADLPSKNLNNDKQEIEDKKYSCDENIYDINNINDKMKNTKKEGSENDYQNVQLNEDQTVGEEHDLYSQHDAFDDTYFKSDPTKEKHTRETTDEPHYNVNTTLLTTNVEDQNYEKEQHNNTNKIDNYDIGIEHVSLDENVVVVEQTVGPDNMRKELINASKENINDLEISVDHKNTPEPMHYENVQLEGGDNLLPEEDINDNAANEKELTYGFDEQSLQDTENYEYESQKIVVTERSDYQQDEHVPNADLKNETGNITRTSNDPALDVEQNEIFYSEQTDVNYKENEQYEQNEFHVNYNENTNYEQRDQYMYYENQTEENLTVHEQVSQDYDPNYEQQYENPYEVPNTNDQQMFSDVAENYEVGEYNQEYQQGPDQIPSEYNEQTSDFDQVHYENQHYDQQFSKDELNKEEGYVETDNTIAPEANNPELSSQSK